MTMKDEAPLGEQQGSEELRSSNIGNNSSLEEKFKVETVAEREARHAHVLAESFARFEKLFSGSDRARGFYNHRRAARASTGEKVDINDSAATREGPATTEHVEKHLLGEDALGIIPIRGDGTVSLGAIDIDKYDVDFPALFKQVEKEGLPLVLCRSKSGGAHLYAFFREHVPAADVQQLLKEWAALLGYPGAEVFPKQKELGPKDLGNWINIPYFEHEETDRYAVKSNGMAMSLGEFCDEAEARLMSVDDLARHLARYQSEARARHSAKPEPEPEPGAMLTPEEARERLEELALGIENAAYKHANNTLWRAIRDAAPLVRDCGLTEGEVHDRLERAWKERKDISTDPPHKIQREFDQTFAKNYAHGFERNPDPRRKRDTLVSRRLSAIPAQPVEWLWPNRIAIGKISLIAGQPGLGKSQLTTYIAARVTTGGPWPFDEGSAPQGEVALLSAEDDAGDTIRPRFEVAHADLDCVHVLDSVARREGGERSLNLEKDVAMLDGLLKGAPDIRLVVIDPISAYLGKIDSNRNSDVRGLLAPLQKLAERHRIAVVAVSHLTKAPQSAINSVNGSGAFVAASRAAYIVGRETDERVRDGETVKEETGRRIVAMAKNNLAPDGADRSMIYHIEQRQTVNGLFAPIVVWDQKVAITADEVLAASAPSPGGRAPKLEAAKTFLREYLAGGLMQQKHVEQAALDKGIRPDTLKNAKRALRIVVDKLGGQSGPWVWSLPNVQTELDVDGPEHDAF